MRATVDAEKCQGHARCWAICPEVCQLDAQGNAISPGEVPAAFEARAREAADNCPERAITLS